MHESRGLRAVVLAAIALLALAPAAGVEATATARSASSRAAATAPGYDISWRQCGGAYPVSPTFGIVGVNKGILFSPNPCLGSEVTWAGAASAALYANTANPGPALSTHWPTGQTSPQVCSATNPDSTQCAYDYGYNAAADSYADAVSAFAALGLSASPAGSPWWLDVETANSWRSDVTLNVAALSGAVYYLGGVAGVGSLGFYSTSYLWGVITGGTSAFSAYSSWVAGGADAAGASANCAGPGFTGGGVTLAQYPSGGFDADLRCSGVHTLVDTSDYPGATCIYDPGLHLKTIKIRQPIVYAFDRTSKTDTEWVAWRYHIEYSSSDAPPEQYVNWPDFAVSSWTKVKATDLDNARWTSGTYTMGSGSGSHPFYRVSIELRWFFPSSSTKDGNAVHVVNNYRIKDSGGQVTVQVACPQSVALGGSAGMAGASGTFGVHVLLDTAEYPAVTCTFHNFDPRDDLMRITVRPPVVYAVDRTSKTDTQKVGWRFRVQATDVPTPTESDWFDVYVAPIVKVTATDAYNGQWKARSFAISNGIAHDDWRAVVDMYWYNPSTGHQAGKAIEFPVNYLQAWDDQSALFGRQSCGETLG